MVSETFRDKSRDNLIRSLIWDDVLSKSMNMGGIVLKALVAGILFFIVKQFL